MTEIPPHVIRMIEESEHLADRIGKLCAFIVGQIYPTLDKTDQTLLSAQVGAMTTYLQVLSLRIERAQLKD